MRDSQVAAVIMPAKEEISLRYCLNKTRWNARPPRAQTFILTLVYHDYLQGLFEGQT